MKAFKGLWLGAVEMGSAEVCFDISSHTHIHTHLPATRARRPFPAVTVLVGISHSGVEQLLEGSGSSDGAALIQREGRPTSL